MKKIPTYEECLKIVEINPSFYRKEIDTFHGYTAEVFNYRIASYTDFEDPLKDGSELNGSELRGLTFVGGATRYLSMHKFFRVNETASTLYDNIKDLGVVSVKTKEDGSLVRFMRLFASSFIAKTKQDFNNEQTQESALIAGQSSRLHNFINESIEHGLAALFELTSPNNRVVIRYKHPHLVLTQLRDEKTGEYLDIYSHPLIKKYNILAVAKKETNPLKYYMDLASDPATKDIEGWVIQLENGQFVKIKTRWYDDLHGLLTEHIDRDDFLVKCILRETIDDVLAKLDLDDPLRNRTESLQTKLSFYINRSESEITDLLKSYKGENRQERAGLVREVKGHSLFPVLMLAATAIERNTSFDYSAAMSSFIEKSCDGQRKTEAFLSSI